MSESKAISLKNLALRLCGEAPDSDITSDKVADVLNHLSSYILNDEELKAWYKDNVYPPLKETDRSADWKKTHGGKAIREIDGLTHARKNAHLIKIRKENFEAFLQNDDKVNSVLEQIKNEKEFFSSNWEKAKKEGHRGKNLKKHYHDMIKGWREVHRRMVKQKKFLKDLYEKNQPWSDAEQPRPGTKRNAPLPGTAPRLQSQIKNDVIEILKNLLKEYPKKKNKFYTQHYLIKEYFKKMKHEPLSQKTIDRHLAQARK